MTERISTGSRDHIDALDGLRATAILLVFLYHLTPGRDSDQGLRALMFKVADIGWTGVDLFFVLSGFLITGKLLQARGEQHRFRNFYIRRSLRIFPLYYAALGFVLIIVPLMSRTVEMSSLGAQLPYWLYYSNFVRPALESDALVRLGHFWSLAIEEQFYLIWPAVIFLTSERRARVICVAIVVAAPVMRFVMASAGGDWVASQAWTPCRADGLALGALLALVYSDERLKRHALRWSIAALTVSAPLLAWTAWRGKAMMVVKSLTTPEAILLRTFLISAAALFFGAVLVMSLELGTLRRVMSHSVFRPLAKYSYGMYVFHFMLFPVFLKTLPQHPALFFLLASTISIVLAMVSYHAFENFFISLKRRWTEEPLHETAP